MADWDDGYVSDIAYVSGYHAETVPVWMATAAAFLGVVAPDLSRPFHYADFGCGNGVTALAVAAAMPNADVWGFDFNPAHVEAGRDVARRAGLTNIHFEEASFDDLARLAPSDLPMFDYVVAHGVLSWVSPENRQRLFTVIGQRVAPGGIAYTSYNVSTGWTGMRPIRTLMRLLVEASPERTDLAAASMFSMLDTIRTEGAAMFAAHPGLGARLDMLRGQDPRYVAHELLNRDWHPLMFSTVSDAMAAIKCEYIGSATLPENMPGLTAPPGLRDLLAQTRDPRLREMTRDLASAAVFRRDLYHRGARRMSPVEAARRMNAIRFARTARPLPETIKLSMPLGDFSPEPALYRAILEILNDGPMTLGQLRGHGSLTRLTPATVPDTIGILAQLGHVAPMIPPSSSAEAVDACARLNQVHAALFEDGQDRPFLVCPELGAAQPADLMDVLAVDEMQTLGTLDEAPLVDALAARIARSGRVPRRDGKPIDAMPDLRAHVTDVVRTMLSARLPVMRHLGILAHGAGPASGRWASIGKAG